MLSIIDTCMANMSTGQILFTYFWAILLPAMGACWLIEMACLRIFKGSKNDWRKL
jgi:hypothetical protein